MAWPIGSSQKGGSIFLASNSRFVCITPLLRLFFISLAAFASRQRHNRSCSCSSFSIYTLRCDDAYLCRRYLGDKAHIK
ncbi:unnamed protein product [Caenorhabditis nigoni]